MRALTDHLTIRRAWNTFEDVFEREAEWPLPVWPRRRAVGTLGVLFPEGYELAEETFAAVRASVADLYGEETYLLAMIEYDPERPQLWEVEWADGPEFDAAQPEVMLFENCIFSPSGRWGVALTAADFALVTGDAAFVRSVEGRLARSFEAQLHDLVEAAVDADDRPADFLKPLLDRLCGAVKADARIQAVIEARRD